MEPAFSISEISLSLQRHLANVGYFSQGDGDIRLLYIGSLRATVEDDFIVSRLQPAYEKLSFRIARRCGVKGVSRPNANR